MSRKNYRHLELLAPGGSFQGVKAAYAAGADAVYMGGHKFSARAYAESAAEHSLEAAIDYAHLHEKQLYLTLNTLLKPGEMEAELYDYVAPLYEQGLDGILVQDLGVLRFIRREFPELPVHASTQMTVTSAESARLLKQLGLTRVVAARELNLRELKEIYDSTGMELEAFVHGAICYCYSGRCLYSSLIGGRSGNRGRCAQPCRLPYSLKDEKGRFMNRKEDSYLLSLKDMSTLEYLPELIEAGVMSFKIEGRMKSPVYTAGIVSIYRKYLDRYLDQGGKNWTIDSKDQYAISQYFDRGGFTQYLTRHNGADMIATKEKAKLRTPDEHLLKETEKQYVDRENKEKINAFVSIYTGSCASITVDNGRVSVTVESTEPVQASLNRPLKQEDVKKQMGKLGNTPYELNQLDIMMSEDAFMPVKQLNELRRQALEALTKEILMQFRRELPGGEKNSVCGKDQLDMQLHERKQTPALHVHVGHSRFLPLVLKQEKVERIYLDSAMGSRKEVESFVKACHDEGKSCYIRLPLIQRGPAKKEIPELLKLGADGLCACTLDALQQLSDLNYDKPVVVDASVYLWNPEAKAMLSEICDQLSLKLEGGMAPLELNEKELKQLGCKDLEVFVYGYQPMMITANCVRKTAGACQAGKKRNACEPVILTDRKRAQFPVQCICRYCYNVIYNSLPCSLLDQEKRLKGLNAKAYYLSFTVETKEEALAVLDCLEAGSGKSLESGTFTRGHFARGVQ